VTSSEPRLRRLEPWLWLIAASVTWNVVFDRQVAVAAIEFTREQIVRAEHGEPVRTIAAAFQPRVGDAALLATAWAALVLVAGALVTRLSGRLRRPRSS
jgi:flagellar biosynthesis/type III secretory pathway M-ring protein FliF/YscJ